MKKLLLLSALLVSLSSFGQEDNKQGLVIKYYKSGEVRKKGNYIDGKLQGEYFWYFKSGEVQKKSKWVDGKVQGEYIEYYESGEIKEIKNYKDGVLIEN